MEWGDYKDLRDSETYKGFRIFPARYDFIEDGKFFISVLIQREGSDALPRNFRSHGEYASTETEAVRRSLAFGRKLIDGVIPGQSLDEI
jgi:hypothetical protein